MLRALHDPDGFFRHRTPNRSLAAPFAVVLAGITSVVTMLAVFAWMTTVSEIGTGRFTTLTVLSSAPVAVGLTVVWFLICAVALHLLSPLLGGDGEFPATLAVAGWGFLPLVVGRPLASLLALATVERGAAGMVDGGTAIAQSTALTAVVGVLILLWQGIVWTFGVKHAHRLPTRTAGTAAGVVVAAKLAWTVAGIV